MPNRSLILRSHDNDPATGRGHVHTFPGIYLVSKQLEGEFCEIQTKIYQILTLRPVFPIVEVIVKSCGGGS